MRSGGPYYSDLIIAPQKSNGKSELIVFLLIIFLQYHPIQNPLVSFHRVLFPFTTFHSTCHPMPS
jgi:hypothetical protein